MSFSCVDKSFGFLPKDAQYTNIKNNDTIATKKLVACDIAASEVTATVGIFDTLIVNNPLPTPAVPVMVGASTLANGVSGLVPQPIIGDQYKYLAGDGTWKNVEIGYIGMNDVTLGGGVQPILNGTQTLVIMNTLFETGYAPHPSFTSNTGTGTFDILANGRYRITASVRMEADVTPYPPLPWVGPPPPYPQNDYILSVATSTQTWQLSTTQFTLTPIVSPGAILNGSVTVDLLAGDIVGTYMFQVNDAGLSKNALGFVTSFAPPFPRTFTSFMQIERLQ